MSQFHRTKTPGVSYKDTRAGKSYYIDYTDDNKRRRREKVPGGYEEARAAMTLVSNKRNHGESVPGRVDVTYRDYSTACIERHEQTGKIKPQSAKRYHGDNERYIFPVIGDMKLAKITKHDVLRVIDTARANGYAGWTINGIITVMSTTFADANWQFGIPNHVQSLKKEHKPAKEAEKPMHILTPDEITGLLGQARKRGLRAYALLLLALYSGLRLSELLGLWWEDLDLLADVPTVRPHTQLAVDGKTRLPYLKGKKEGQFRLVEIPREVAKTLAAWKMESPHSLPADYVFLCREDDGPLRQAPARNVFVACRDKAGIQAGLPEEQRCEFHDMRDTFASMLIHGGANIVEVAAALGHTKANGDPDPTTTLKHYAGEWKKLEKRGKLRDILEASAV